MRKYLRELRVHALKKNLKENKSRQTVESGQALNRECP